MYDLLQQLLARPNLVTDTDNLFSWCKQEKEFLLAIVVAQVAVRKPQRWFKLDLTYIDGNLELTQKNFVTTAGASSSIITTQLKIFSQEIILRWSRRPSENNQKLCDEKEHLSLSLNESQRKLR